MDFLSIFIKTYNMNMKKKEKIAERIICCCLMMVLTFQLCIPAGMAYAEEGDTGGDAGSDASVGASADSGVTDVSTGASSEGTQSADPSSTESSSASSALPSSESEQTPVSTETPMPASTPPESADSTSSESISASMSSSSHLSQSASISAPDASTTQASTTPPTVIETGQAIAVANVLNVVNTNLVNSNGYIIFSNLFDDQAGTLDFRNPASSTNPCGLNGCDSSDVRIAITNDADIDNGITLMAITGNNEMEGNANSVIDTGDAYAGLNLVNVANTNFIDSDYVLITVNAFRGVNGDIIFPSLSKFFMPAMGNMSNGTSTGANDSGASLNSMRLSNIADVTNNIGTNAESGDNDITDASSSLINSGNAQSLSNIYNQINSTLAGGNNVSVLFRIHGNWSGEIFGVPDGFRVVRGADGGVFIMSEAGADAQGGAETNSAQTQGNQCSDCSGQDLSIEGTSTARIHNDVDLLALTGRNRITGADTALITTGNAYAGANLVNIANANVVSRNWMMAIVNIFGDFAGNIAFGRPDLWVGAAVNAPSHIDNGTELDYTLTVKNNGDSDADNVRLTDTIDGEHQEIVEASIPFSTNTLSAGRQTLAWDMGTMKEGDMKEVTYKVRVKNTVPDTEMRTAANVGAHETDNNATDNSDILSVRTTALPSGGQTGGGGTVGTNTNSNANSNNGTIGTSGIIVDRISASSTVVAGGNSVEQKLIVRNPFDQVMNDVTIYDVLHDVRGQVVRKEKFDIGDLKPHEEVTIKYDIAFAADAEAGTYAFSTLVTQPGTIDSLIPMNGRLYVVSRQVAVADIHSDKDIDAKPISDPDENMIRGIVAGISTDDELDSSPAEAQDALTGFLTDLVFSHIANADTIGGNGRSSRAGNWPPVFSWGTLLGASVTIGLMAYFRPRNKGKKYLSH
jgi:uncharacterized repeat protein (TIGR01451 family)